MNEDEVDLESTIEIDEYFDGEVFTLTEVIDGEDQDQIMMVRECAKQVINLLQEMIGED